VDAAPPRIADRATDRGAGVTRGADLVASQASTVHAQALPRARGRDRVAMPQRDTERRAT
jgi:hypothetical protein